MRLQTWRASLCAIVGLVPIRLGAGGVAGRGLRTRWQPVDDRRQAAAVWVYAGRAGSDLVSGPAADRLLRLRRRAAGWRDRPDRQVPLLLQHGLGGVPWRGPRIQAPD